MINFLNYLVAFNILGLAGMFFPEYVQYDNAWWIILAVVLTVLIKNMIGLLFIHVGMIMVTNKKSKVIFIIALMMYCILVCSTPIALFVVSSLLKGFTIKGIFTYIIISIWLRAFTIGEND